MKTRPERLEKQKKYDKDYIERKREKGLTRTLLWIKSNSVDKIKNIVKDINRFTDSDPVGN